MRSLRVKKLSKDFTACTNCLTPITQEMFTLRNGSSKLESDGNLGLTLMLIHKGQLFNVQYSQYKRKYNASIYPLGILPYFVIHHEYFKKSTSFSLLVV